jgi:hypothetical protein
MRKEFQIRIDSDDNDLLVCESYRTLKQVQRAYPKILRAFKRAHANEDGDFHAEIVEVLDQEQVEPFQHEGCECAKCGKIIGREESGESSEHGSVHHGCAS